jgi:hypothetical protein
MEARFKRLHKRRINRFVLPYIQPTPCKAVRVRREYLAGGCLDPIGARIPLRQVAHLNGKARRETCEGGNARRY